MAKLAWSNTDVFGCSAETPSHLFDIHQVYRSFEWELYIWRRNDEAYYDNDNAEYVNRTLVSKRSAKQAAALWLRKYEDK